MHPLVALAGLGVAKAVEAMAVEAAVAVRAVGAMVEVARAEVAREVAVRAILSTSGTGGDGTGTGSPTCSVREKEKREGDDAVLTNGAFPFEHASWTASCCTTRGPFGHQVWPFATWPNKGYSSAGYV